MPIQSVLFAVVTDDPLSELLYLVAVVSLAEILLLCADESIASRDRGQLTLTDTAGNNFVLTCCCIEVPLAGRILCQRNWKRIVVTSNNQNLASCVDLTPAIHLFVPRHEVLQCVLIFHRITRIQDILDV